MHGEDEAGERLSDAHARTTGERADKQIIQLPSRRQILKAGLGVVAGIPLAGVLAACGQGTYLPPEAIIPTPTSTPLPTPTPDTRPITMVITGDVMLGRAVNGMIASTSDRFPFNNTADFLKSFDLTVGNLECVVSTLGTPEPKEFTFEANPRGFNRLVSAGFDIMSLANNHSGDYGKQAFMDMYSNLPKHGITPLGGGPNLAAAHAPVIRTVRTTTVGLLAYCEIDPENFAATKTTPGHAWLDPQLMQADIKAARGKADFLIVFTHWGIEYQTVEEDQQMAMARLAIDAGADLVVGAHPHVRQPYEKYKGKLIVYSLGNFVFDEMPGYEESHGNVLCLTLQGPKLVDWKLRGSVIVGAYGQPQWV